MSARFLSLLLVGFMGCGGREEDTGKSTDADDDDTGDEDEGDDIDDG